MWETRGTFAGWVFWIQIYCMTTACPPLYLSFLPYHSLVPSLWIFSNCLTSTAMSRDTNQFAGRDSGLPPSSKSQGNNYKHNKPAPSSSITTRRRAPVMPTLTNLEGLALQSPSTQIVGTPFDSTSKFEYPYPDSNSGSDPVSSAESTYSSVHPSPMVNLSPPIAGGCFPFFSASASSTPYTVPGLSYSDMSSSSSSSTTSSTSSFTPIHSKFKPPANPPMPPSLVKKHHRRRKNSFEGQDFEGALRAEHDGVLHSKRDEGRRAEYWHSSMKTCARSSVSCHFSFSPIHPNRITMHTIQPFTTHLRCDLVPSKKKIRSPHILKPRFPYPLNPHSSVFTHSNLFFYGYCVFRSSFSFGSLVLCSHLVGFPFSLTTKCSCWFYSCLVSVFLVMVLTVSPTISNSQQLYPNAPLFESPFVEVFNVSPLWLFTKSRVGSGLERIHERYHTWRSFALGVVDFPFKQELVI